MNILTAQVEQKSLLKTNEVGVNANQTIMNII